MSRKNPLENAETVALQALAYLAGSATDLSRFVEASGVAPNELRARAEEPAVLAAVLAFILSDDERLLAFCSEQGLEPKHVHLAQHTLEHGPKFMRR